MTLVPLDQKHIAEGIAGDCCACPVILALNDAGRYPSSVQPEEICWIDEDEGCDDERETTDTSRVLFDWMRRFDQGETCKPITIVVEPDLATTLAEWQEAHR